MDVSVVVVSFNTRDFLEQCLTSIRKCLASIDGEIVVVDNASEDGSVEMVALNFPETMLIRNVENVGFARAVNQGIRASAGECVLLVNSDAILLNDAIHDLLVALANRPSVAAVGGTLLNPDGTFQGSYADFPTLLSETLLLTGFSRWLLPPTFPSHAVTESRTQCDVDWVCGAFLMLRRGALNDIGHLDERFFMYAEEVDWCYRAHQRGWSITFVPQARATHAVAGSYSQGTQQHISQRRRAQIYRSKWLYLRKHRGATVGAFFRGLVWVVSAAKLAAWAVSGISPMARRRDQAQHHVASYRYLLGHF